MLFVLGGHTLDTDRRELRRGDDIIAVEPQVFDLLVYLVENCDRVVSKDDLIASVWHNRIVSDSTLTSRINAARKALGDSGGEQKLIRTVPRKGCASSARYAQNQASASSVKPRSDRNSTSRPVPRCRFPTVRLLRCFPSSI